MSVQRDILELQSKQRKRQQRQRQQSSLRRRTSFTSTTSTSSPSSVSSSSYTTTDEQRQALAAVYGKSSIPCQEEAYIRGLQDEKEMRLCCYMAQLPEGEDSETTNDTEDVLSVITSSCRSSSDDVSSISSTVTKNGTTKKGSMMKPKQIILSPLRTLRKRMQISPHATPSSSSHKRGTGVGASSRTVMIGLLPPTMKTMNLAE